jgi:phosphate uptake regulator
VDLFLILAAAEKKLDELDVPAEEKEEARGVLRRMRDVGSTMLTDAVAAVLSDAVRKALGLP